MEKPKFFNVQNIVILFLCVLCLGTYLYTAAEFQNFVSAKQIHTAKHNILNPTNIQQWMTFSYIDYVFKLPPTYLQTSLNITDNKYPEISLKEYAEDHNIKSSSFLIDVKGKVNTYEINSKDLSE